MCEVNDDLLRESYNDNYEMFCFWIGFLDYGKIREIYMLEVKFVNIVGYEVYLKILVWVNLNIL